MARTQGLYAWYRETALAKAGPLIQTSYEHATSPIAPCTLHPQFKFGKPRNTGGAGGGGSGPTAAVALLSNIADIEELVTMGRSAGVCPFYLGREAGMWCCDALSAE